MAIINGFKTPIIFYENLSKAVARLPNYLRTRFFKATCDYDLNDGTINLLSFEVWLEKRVKDLSNPLAEIISLQDAKSNKHQHVKDQSIKNPYKIHTNHLNKESKLDEKKDQKGKQMENQEKMSCWLCKQKHHMVDCPQFRDKSVEEKIDFATKEKLCKNCFLKGHTTKDCICKLKRKANSCGKKHHTILYRQDQRQVSINSRISHKKTNLPKTTISLQVLPVKVSNGSQTVEVNALLHAGSDMTIITSKLADELQIKGVKKDLNISSAIAEPVTVVSRLVNFSLSSKHHPNWLEVKNAWVVDILNLPQQKVAPNDIKKCWSHLKYLPLETSDKEISVLIGADLPQLCISYDVRAGENDHPVGMLTKLGWVLLSGKADKGKTNVTLNHVKTHGLQKLVQKFWKIESYAT